MSVRGAEDRPTEGRCYTAGPDIRLLMQELSQVLDPELDESILQLGFIESLQVEGGRAIVEVRLPTYWCAANFAYLMAHDIRTRLLAVEGLETVIVQFKDHFASGSLEEGVNAGKSFIQAFPGEAHENLDSLRAIFLRKGFIKRQERLLRCFLDTGLSPEEVSNLCVGDLILEDDSCVAAPGGRKVLLTGIAEPARRYLERMAEINLDTSPKAPLFTDLGGRPVPPDRMREHLKAARVVRASLEANTLMCEALLSARRSRGGQS